MREILEKQGYHFIGDAAVKSCLWTKKSLRGEGECYKSKFYGIASHRCIQMTPSLLCNQKCLFCWRAFESGSVSFDPPEKIVEGCIREHRRLVSGYHGYEGTSEERFREALNPKHVAISLSGEPTLYPHLSELIELFHERGLTTFLVSNGTNPEVIRRVRPTQLYISLDAPDEETYRKVCQPVGDTWERVLESLRALRHHPSRTTIRVTAVKGYNMKDEEKYGKLIKEASPDYVEIKAYMHLGFSRMRLRREAMPSHEEIRKFAMKIAESSGYKIADESEISRVVLLSKDGSVEKLKIKQSD